MPGKLYKNDVRLSKAHSEGFEAANGASNPHPPGTPAAHAWDDGYLQGCDPDGYRGNALNTANYWCAPGGPGGN
jgi:hypothetical protein